MTSSTAANAATPNPSANPWIVSVPVDRLTAPPSRRFVNEKRRALSTVRERRVRADPLDLNLVHRGRLAKHVDLLEPFQA